MVDNPSILYYVKSETVTFIFLLSRNTENYSYLMEICELQVFTGVENSIALK